MFAVSKTQLAVRRTQVELFAFVVSGEDEVEALGEDFEEPEFGDVERDGVSPVVGGTDEPPAVADGFVSTNR